MLYNKIYSTPMASPYDGFDVADLGIEYIWNPGCTALQYHDTAIQL